MAGSSNWVILYNNTSGQVTRRVWDDSVEVTLQHPAAQPAQNETAILYPTPSFQASVASALTYGYVVEVDPALMTAVAQHAQVAANAVAFANATATATATKAIINTILNPPPVTVAPSGGASL